MHVAVIGGSGHYPYVLSGVAARDDISLLSIAPGTKGESLANLESACDKLGLTPCRFGDWRELLDSTNIDIAAINPWYCDSAAISMECLRRGISVYSEKPVATEIAELDALEAAYRKSSADLGCMLDGRHTPWLRTIQKAVSQGEIGTIRLLHGQKSYRMGVRTGVYEKRASYGGMLTWIAIHPLSWFRYLLESDPVWLSAQTDDAYNRGFGELETTGCILARYEGGVLATINADFYRPDASARHDDDRIRVTGTKGMLEAIDGRVYLENESPRRELPLEKAENPFLFFADALGTPSAKQQAETAFAVSRTSLLSRDIADKARSSYAR